MNDRQARRISREVTPTERERLQKLREQIAEELPDMTARDQLRKEAREEATLSGDLRRAIHASQRPGAFGAVESVDLSDYR